MNRFWQVLVSVDYLLEFIETVSSLTTSSMKRHCHHASPCFLALSVALTILISCTSVGAEVATCDEAGLRAAIQQGGTVTFACDGVITLSQTISISGAVTLDGTGRSVVLSGGGAVRLFEVTAGGALGLVGLTVQDGKSTGGGAVLNEGTLAATNVVFKNNRSVAALAMPARGGAILSRGSLVLQRCSLEGNAASSTNEVQQLGQTGQTSGYAARGGAVFGELGTIMAKDCAWIGNWAEAAAGASRQDGGFAGGGALFAEAVNLESVNNTFALNRVVGGLGAQGGGGPSPDPNGNGGEAKGGAIYVGQGRAQIYHNTIANNDAIPGGPGIRVSNNTGGYLSNPGSYGISGGAGVFNENGSVQLANSILAFNFIKGPAEICLGGFTWFGNYQGALTDLGFNLSTDGTVPMGKHNTDPKLGPLSLHGGVTKSFSLLEGSPAIDFSNARYSPERDQRGVSRLSGRVPDAGAFEIDIPAFSSADTAVLRGQIANGGIIKFSGFNYFNVAEALNIVKDTTLDATVANVIFDGLGGSRVFRVAPGVKFTIINASMVNGYANEGAGIYNEGNTTLWACKFNGNVAAGVPGAPGTNSFLKWYGTDTAVGGPGSAGGTGRGGAIYNLGSILSSNCFFINNSALGGPGGTGGAGGMPDNTYMIFGGPRCRSTGGGGSGGIGGDGGRGQGAVVWNGGVAVFDGGDFGYNATVGGLGGEGGPTADGIANPFPNEPPGRGALGGAANGGAIYSIGTVRVANAAFAAAVAEGGRGGRAGTSAGIDSIGRSGDGGEAVGGAVSMSGMAYFTNCTFALCQARGGGGGPPNSAGYCIPGSQYASGSGGNATGGAIYRAGAGVVFAQHCTYFNNTATGGIRADPVRADCSTVATNGLGIVSTIDVASGEARLLGSIISNVGSAPSCRGLVTDLGFNIVSDSPAMFVAGTSRTNLDARLVEVSAVGGLPFYRPGLDSPARDFVPAGVAPAMDQRGVLRPVGAAADVGAIELTMAEVPPVIGIESASTMSLTYLGRPGTDYV
ncbi:MAG TPA: choice-of-anchor Q domain-containing protein, partial [Verrucomicrobiae bacterium]|nr:choice-of-anchor Q domain-containing protein [Verrucomicrobiae bacterium]